MQKFDQFRNTLVSNVRALSSFRKAFVALSLAGVPTFIAVGWAVQAANVLEGLTSAIIWFTVTAVDATLFFWLWEEITERTPSHRRVAMIILGAIVIVFYYRGVSWAMKTAYEASLASEIRDQTEGIRDMMLAKMYHALIKQQSLVQSPVKLEHALPRLQPPPPALPSFVFVVPGVVLNGNSWDFIVNHRGPNPSFNVEILFVDDVKKEQTLKAKTSLTIGELNSYQTTLRYAEIDPKGRGSIFATQFIWTPPVLDHERYSVDITWREGTVHQELQIEQVNGKWFWATEITNRENGKVLVNCKDKGFPYGQPQSKACFPEMLQPGL